MSQGRIRREIMPMSSSVQPPPDHFGAVEWVLIVSTSAVLALLIFAVMAVATLVSVTAFVLAPAVLSPR
jgi:hypothetical protein